MFKPPRLWYIVRQTKQTKIIVFSIVHRENVDSWALAIFYVNVNNVYLNISFSVYTEK